MEGSDLKLIKLIVSAAAPVMRLLLCFPERTAVCFHRLFPHPSHATSFISDLQQLVCVIKKKKKKLLIFSSVEISGKSVIWFTKKKNLDGRKRFKGIGRHKVISQYLEAAGIVEAKVTRMEILNLKIKD